MGHASRPASATSTGSSAGSANISHVLTLPAAQKISVNTTTATAYSRFTRGV